MFWKMVLKGPAKVDAPEEAAPSRPERGTRSIKGHAHHIKGSTGEVISSREEAKSIAHRVRMCILDLEGVLERLERNEPILDKGVFASLAGAEARLGFMRKFLGRSATGSLTPRRTAP